MIVRYHSRFFVRVGHETAYADIGNHHFFTIPMSLSELPKLLRSSVKPVHKTEDLNNFGRSDDDMV